MSSVNSELNPLGQKSEYKDEYDPSLLFSISRDESWKSLGLKRDAVTFYGVDIWNGYEISWLNKKGKPIVLMAEFHIPASSPYLIESKSFKLYLNSFNQSKFESKEEVLTLMVKDLSNAAGAGVNIIFHTLDTEFEKAPQARCIDDLDIEITSYQPDASLLQVTDKKHAGWISSHLLKSNCPVTGQPDWGSLYIYYEGKEIDEASLLAYIVSLRQHEGFHEQCVEQVFHDLSHQCQPEKLTVYARYVRRGGLDINPFRSSEQEEKAVNFALSRQ